MTVRESMVTGGGSGGRTVQLPAPLAGFLLALFLLVPVGSAYLAGRGSAAQPQVVVYQLPPTQQQVWAPPGYSAPHTGALPLVSSGAYAMGAPPAMGVPLSVQAGPIDELRKLVDALNPERFVPKFFEVLARQVTGLDEHGKPLDGRPDIVSEVGSWLLQTPQFASPGFAAGATIRGYVGSLQAVGWAVFLCATAAAAIRFKLGHDQEPSTTVVRFLLCGLMLGFYDELFVWATGASNAITAGVFHIRLEHSASWKGLLNVAIPGVGALNSLVAIGGFFALLVVGFVRVLSLALLLVVYALGPLVVPLRLVPEWDFFSQWWQTGMRALVWPIAWAVEAKLILELTKGMTGFGLAGVVFAPLAQLALLYAMVKTPSWIAVAGSHANPKVLRTMQQVQYVGRTTRYAAAAYGTGGLSAAASAIATGLAPNAARGGGARP